MHLHCSYVIITLSQIVTHFLDVAAFDFNFLNHVNERLLKINASLVELEDLLKTAMCNFSWYVC